MIASEEKVSGFGSRPFVGRGQELAVLHSALDRVEAGHGQLALISGEAGIGKTALTEQIVRQADRRQLLTLIGHSYDRDASPPYGPWRELLQDYSDMDLQGLPTVPNALMDPASGNGISNPDELHALASQFVNELARHRPLLLVIEDLHWADQASLDLLRICARRLAKIPVLILATYRDAELSTRHPLYQALPQLVREVDTARLRLPPIDIDAIRLIVQGRYELSSPDQERLAEFLSSRADGNPFFIEELLSTLEHGRVLRQRGHGWELGDLTSVPLPPLIRQLIDGQAGRLSPRTRQAIEVAAVIGNEIPYDLWATVLEEPEHSLTEIVHEAREAALLVELREKASFQFRHALIQQALYEGLLLPQRRAWHQRIAEAMAAQTTVNPDIIAHHFARAGDARAREWLIRAGDHALASHAPFAAVEHYSQAFELTTAAGAALPIDALRQRGLAFAMVGDFAGARQDFEKILRRTRESGDRMAEWQALIDLGTLWTERDYERAGVYFQSALSLAGDLDDESTLATSLDWLGNWHLNAAKDGGQIETAIGFHKQALEFFERLDDSGGTATTCSMLSMDHLICGDLVQSLSYARRTADLYETANDPIGSASAQMALLATSGVYEFNTELPASGDLDEPGNAGQLAIELAREATWFAGQAFASAAYASHLGMRGSYRAALEYARLGLSLAQEINHREWTALAHINSGWIDLDIFDLTSARDHLERALTLANDLRSFVHRHLAAAALAATYVAGGELDRAEALISDVLLNPDGSEFTAVERGCEYVRATIALENGDPESALVTIEGLIETTLNASEDMPQPYLSLVHGQTLLALDRPDEAVLVLSRAEGVAERLGWRSVRWRLLAALATALTELERNEEARAALDTATTMIGELAAELPDEEMSERFTEQAMRHLPEISHPAGRLLSPREVEVLELAARGLTNAEIGEELFISPRTVHGHLHSIFNKLGVNSRTAAASFAFEHNLI